MISGNLSIKLRDMQALDHIGADAATTVMFEDSLWNIRASKQLGMGTGMFMILVDCRILCTSSIRAMLLFGLVRILA